MARVIGLIGKSGSGKTTIMDELRKLGRIPILSNTSRPMRPGEQQGREYNFLSQRAFDEYAAQDLFLKVYRLGSGCYGTFKRAPNTPIELEQKMYLSIDETLNADTDGLHVIMPDAVPLFMEYCGNKFVPFYILSPGDEELFKRMTSRGENPESVKKRMQLDKHWDTQAKSSGLPYIFISNNANSIQPAVEEVLRYLDRKN